MGSDPSILSISVSGPAAQPRRQVHSDQDGGKPGCSAHLWSEHRAPGAVLHHEHGSVLRIQPLQTWNCQVWGSSRDCLPRHSGCEQHGSCLLVPRGPEAVRHREEDVSRGGSGLETGQGPGLEVSSKLIIENLLMMLLIYIEAIYSIFL